MIRRFSFDQFDGMIGAAPEAAEATGATKDGFKLPEDLRQGDRHTILYNLLRSQKARGVSLTAALACCHAENLEKCDPPIDHAELDTYHRRVWNQADSPEFTAATKDFRLTAKGDAIRPNDQENIAVACRKLGVALSFDLFAQKPMIEFGGYKGALQDEVRNRLWLEIDKRFGFRPSAEFFDIVIQDIAFANKFHPVRDYLDSLTWDGVPRVDTWLTTYCQSYDMEYTRAVGALVLIAAVRRVRKPGCKFDEMLVLESGQGLQKSTALQALCPVSSWFSDDLPLNVDAKQIIERTLGKWIIEAAELSGMHKSQAEHLKSMLSRQVDGPVRLAYARLPVEQHRQFVIIGTTNSHTYLNDSTGNRRFWPIRVEFFDIPGLRRDRDQLWAEAAHREALGESIRLKESLYAHAEIQQEDRASMDPWELEIALKFDQEYQRIAPDELWETVGVPMERRDDRGQRRLSQIMQKLGYRRMTVSNREKRVVKGWGKGDRLPDDTRERTSKGTYGNEPEF